MTSALRPAVFAVLATLFGAAAAPAVADDAGAGSTARANGKPVRLIEFTGNREFLKTSTRLRVWRGDVGYTLEVDAAGMPTDCQILDEFRMKYVNDKLCEVLLKHHTFEPAQDATGAAVDGSYKGHLNYVELREKE